jgi:hypothetical protein
MAPEMIVVVVVLSLLILISIAFTIQTIEKNNKEKRRLESALLKRASNFEYMLTGLPQGLINNDLKLLICKCLIEVSEQLNELFPNKKEYQKQLEQAQARFDETKAQGSSSAAVPDLRDQAQIREVQKLLTSLFNFIARLRANNRLNDQQAQAYALHIRRLMLKTSLDLLEEHARQATQTAKFRLAIHHYTSAVEKIRKENESEYFSQHLQKYQERIAQLEVQEQERLKREALRQDRDPNRDAWGDELKKQDDSWKKKNVYD